jgi:hypothetical protein
MTRLEAETWGSAPRIHTESCPHEASPAQSSLSRPASLGSKRPTNPSPQSNDAPASPQFAQISAVHRRGGDLTSVLLAPRHRVRHPFHVLRRRHGSHVVIRAHVLTDRLQPLQDALPLSPIELP